jgi:DNA repair photolyase
MHSETDFVDDPEPVESETVPDAEGRTWVDWHEKDIQEKDAYKWFMRTDPGMREFMGPIEVEDDPITGRMMKWRWAKIAMLRGKSNMTEMKVYLDPWPHIRLGSAKPLQGWYSNRWDGALQNQRDRPCDTDAILTQPYGGWCNISCTFCLPGETLLDTTSGPQRIDSLTPGEKVLAREAYGVVESTVLKTSQRIADGLIVITLDDGSVVSATREHPFIRYNSGIQVRADQIKIGDELEGKPDEPIVQNLWEQNTLGIALDLRRAELLRREQKNSSSVPSSQGKDESSVQILRESDSERTFGMQQFQLLHGEQTSRSESSQVTRGESRPQIGYNSSQNECSYVGSPSKPSEGSPQDLCLEVENGRAFEAGQAGLLQVETHTIHHEERKDNQMSVNMGIPCGGIPGQLGFNLEIRTESAGHRVRSLPARLLGSGMESIYRSERLVSSRTEGEIREIPETVSDPLVESNRVRATRYTVSKVERISGEVEVFDIQTTSENFYLANGLLSKNCYINSGSRGYRGSGLITVPINYGEWVTKRLEKMQRGQAGYFSSFTEPFINLEDYYHNTQAGAMAFTKAGLPVFFLSRRRYPDWALDILKMNKYSYAQKSINTPDPAVWKKLSPNAIELNDNFADLKRIHDAGIYTSIQVNPIIPGLVSHEGVEELLEKLAASGANHVIVKFVECSWAFTSTMVARVRKQFGDKIGDAFAEVFTENQCGAQRTVNENYRRDGHNRYRALATKLGMTYSLCYEYTNVNRANPEGKKEWHSMGEEFRTSDQCHGHFVPWHVKTAESNGLFVPMEEYCPPAGCLTCPTKRGDGNLGACGDQLFSDAKALVEKDFKVPYAGKPVLRVINA